MSDNVSVKVAKLLAAAEGASTQEEATALYEKAQHIASAYAIDMAVARLALDDKQKADQLIKRHITVVAPGAKRSHSAKFLLQLMIAIAEVQDCRMTLAHNSSFGNVFGMESDVNMTEQLWLAIAPVMQRLAEEYLATDEWRNDKVWRNKREKIESVYGHTYWEDNWGYHPATKQSARASYFESFITEIKIRLREAKNEELKAAEQREKHFHDDTAIVVDGTEKALPLDAENKTVAKTAALALREKVKDVDDFYSKTSNARGSWKGYQRSGGFSGSAGAAGRRDGAKVSLSGAARIGGGPKAVSN